MWDVAVIGAGPAGSITAYCLARRGHNVCLLDKETFPRHKPCGGGLPLHAVKLLNEININIDSIVERVTDQVKFFYNSTDPVDADLDDAPVTMVDRGKFDTLLARSAESEGADFYEGTGFEDIRIEENMCRIIGSDREFTSRYVVGADGANSRVGRAVGLKRESECGVALDAEIKVTDEIMQRESSTSTFDVNFVEEGYGWIFPKGECLSMGVGGYRSDVSYPQRMNKFINSSLGDEDILQKDIYGHPLPYFDGETNVVKERVGLVGDAAGMVDALSGEGIFYAMKGGKIMAESLEDVLDEGRGNLSLYEDRLEETIFRELRWSSRLASVFFSFPKKCYENGVKRPEVVNWIKKVVVSESSYDEIYEKIWNEIKSRMENKMLSAIGLN